MRPEPKFGFDWLVEDTTGKRYVVVDRNWSEQDETWWYRLVPQWSLPPGRFHRLYGLPEDSLKEVT